MASQAWYHDQAEPAGLCPGQAEQSARLIAERCEGTEGEATETMTYVNPLSRMQGLVPERIDQGVDYGGTGPILSIGDGLVLETNNSGWPGGAFIAIRLTDGQYAGNVTYFAEDITPTVKVGQTVTAGEQVGTVFAGGSGIEVGWGDPLAIGESMARAAGQIAPTGDAGAVSSAYGASFSNFLKSLGAPGGILQGAIVGTVSGNYPSPEGPTIVTRTMYDALEASGIPHGAQIACWYPHDPRSDGPPVNAAVVLTIDNVGDHPDCNILDVEPGAAPTSSVARWLDSNHNEFPTIYCSESNVGSVVQAAGSRKFYLWVANWNGSPTVIYFPQYNTVTTVAHQYASNNSFDTSVVYNDAWYGKTPAPPPPPPSPVGVPANPKAVGFAGVTLSWGAVKAGDVYRYQLWRGTAMEPTTSTMVADHDTTATTVDVSHIGAGSFAWHVGVNGGAWTATQTFVIPW